VEADYKGTDFHLQAKWLNPGSYGLSYFQSVTKTLGLGFDIFYNYKQRLAITTLGGRWVRDKDVIAIVGTYGHLTCSYAYRLSDRITLATELIFQLSQSGWESSWNAGGECAMRMASFKGSINSAGKITGVLEQGVSDTSKVVICGELDHPKKQYRFGLGIQLQG